jgi:hypothetical protein
MLLESEKMRSAVKASLEESLKVFDETLIDDDVFSDKTLFPNVEAGKMKTVKKASAQKRSKAVVKSDNMKRYRQEDFNPECIAQANQKFYVPEKYFAVWDDIKQKAFIFNKETKKEEVNIFF